MQTNASKRLADQRAARVDRLAQALTRHAEVTIACLAEDTPVRGNFASGDDAEDRAMEDDILSQLADGNEWAWCYVRVTATWEEFKGIASLGGCSYLSESDFMRCEGDNLTSEALEDLARSILSAHERSGAFLALLDAAGGSL
jgi:hypothetical protein